MEQKGLFEEEGRSEDVSMEGEIEDLGEKLGKPKKSNLKLLLGIGLLLVVGAYAANMFLLKKEEPVTPPAPKRIPIKAAPVMGVATAVPVPAKEIVKAKEKVEVKKPAEIKVAKKEEPKPEVREPAEVKVAKKEEVVKPKPVAKEEARKPVTAAKKEGITVVIGTYAARYELDAALDRLKGTGIKAASRDVRKRLAMNRVLVKEAGDKGEADSLISDLRGKGYDPFSVLKNGRYKVYAVSNLDEDISKENKADLEKLGYEPVIEKVETSVRAYELFARAKSAKDAKALMAKLQKVGFRPEIGK
jgi:hypothetical protein